MLPEPVFNRKLWSFILRIDCREAERVREADCRYCGGVLHCANHVRELRGVPVLLGAKRADLACRHSFCCGDCRRRTKPASVRFPGRRVYVGLVVVLLPAPLGDGSSSAALSACRRFHLSLRTLRRWWQEEFWSSRFWRAHRSRLVPGAVARLAGDLVDGVRGGCVGLGVRALPWRGGSSCFLFTSSVTLRRIGAAVSTAGSTDIRHPVSADGRLPGSTDA